jgi:hypothetical protein
MQTDKTRDNLADDFTLSHHQERMFLLFVQIEHFFEQFVLAFVAALGPTSSRNRFGRQGTTLKVSTLHRNTSSRRSGARAIAARSDAVRALAMLGASGSLLALLLLLLLTSP